MFQVKDIHIIFRVEARLFFWQHIKAKKFFQRTGWAKLFFWAKSSARLFFQKLFQPPPQIMKWSLPYGTRTSRSSIIPRMTLTKCSSCRRNAPPAITKKVKINSLLRHREELTSTAYLKSEPLDIPCLTEIKQCPGIMDRELRMSGYTCCQRGGTGTGMEMVSYAISGRTCRVNTDRT